MADEEAQFGSEGQEPVGAAAPATQPLLWCSGSVAAAADNSQAWMTTFADLVALLLTFFVLLFAMSRIETRDWQNLTDALSEHLNSVNESKVAVPSAQLDLNRTQPVPGTNLDYLRSVLQDQMAAHPILSRGELERHSDRLVISLPANLLFAPGSVEPSAQAAGALQATCGILRNLENRIEIAGHADPTPAGQNWSSNWALSLGRALSVAAMLQRSCYRGAIVALGHGHTRYFELPENLPDAQRRAQARRVDIVVHETAGRAR